MSYVNAVTVCASVRTDLLEENGVVHLHPVVLRRRDAYPVGLELLRGASVHLGGTATRMLSTGLYVFLPRIGSDCFDESFPPAIAPETNTSIKPTFVSELCLAYV